MSVHDDSAKYFASVLELNGNESKDEIRRKYLELAKQYHPDKVSHLGPKLRQVAEEEMKRINEAYEYFRRNVAERQRPEETYAQKNKNTSHVYSKQNTHNEPDHEELRLEPGTLRRLILTGNIPLEMIWCPPGTCTMGSPSREKGRSNNETQLSVKLTQGFWIGKYPVTQAQWEAVMGNNSSHFKRTENIGFFSSIQHTLPNHPAECVSWNGVQEFCRKAGNGLRLPTEAEWEYACRAGSTDAYCFGNDASQLSIYAWYGENSNSQTHPVGKKKPNIWGIYDMHGNVWEWCKDWSSNYLGSSTTHSLVETSASYRVVKGGCWNSTASICRSANRRSHDPIYPYSNIGFRLALVR